MKNCILRIAVTSLLLLGAGLAAFADENDFTVNGFNYRILTEETVTLTGCRDNMYNAIIPETISYNGQNYSVTEIDYGALSKKKIIYCTIPNSVTKIGTCAFQSCHDLVQVIMGNSLLEIETSAFEACPKLTDVTLSCSLTTIGTSAFSQCSSLEYINIPKSVTAIGPAAFARCSNLKSIRIDGAVTKIEYSTFSECSNLSAVILPSSVEEIESTAFVDCTNLNSITFSPKIIGPYAFAGCENLKVINWGDCLEEIGEYAFRKCNSIQNLELPQNLQKIGKRAFEECNNLATVSYKENLSEVEEYAFCRCRNLTSFDLSPEVHVSAPKTIGHAAFANCNKLASTHRLNAGVIGGSAFAGCDLTSLKDIITDATTHIKESAFSGCTKLTSVTIPRGVTQINLGAFINCDNLTEVIFEAEKCTVISNSAIYPSKSVFSPGITKLTIGNQVTQIPECIFYGCTGLTSVDIPESVTEIGASAFNSCSNLASVSIGNSVDSIGARAFYSSGLISIDIPDSVKKIKMEAFMNCRNVNSISIGRSVESIGRDAFNGCNEKEVNVTAITPPAFTFCRDILSDGYVHEYFNFPFNYYATLNVPNEAVGFYLRSPWKRFNNIPYTPIKGESIKLDSTEIKLELGQSHEITCSLFPLNATSEITISSSDDKIVKIADFNRISELDYNHNDWLAKIETPGIGTAEITVTCDNVSAKCIVTVTPVFTKSITLNKSSLELEVKSTAQLTAKVLPEDATNKKVKWSSSADSIASVDDTGKVKAHAVGTATITATSTDGSNLTADCIVTVPEVPAKSISISCATKSLKVGQIVKVFSSIKPSTATDKTLTWISHDENILKIYKDETADVEFLGFEIALLEAVGVGEAWIEAKTSNGISAYETITVSPAQVESIELTAEQESIKVGETTTINAAVFPENATNKTLSWDSNDESIATVDQNGIVTGVGVGATDINARATDGSDCIQAIRIHVTPTPVESLMIEPTGSTTLQATQSVQLIAKIHPENSTTRTATWSSSDESVATVDQNGIVTAHSTGSATITATAEGKSAYIDIIVEQTFATGITLNRTSAVIKVNGTIQLSAEITPESTTDKNIEWTSSDTSIATVSDNGIITALQLGECDITATAKDGSNMSAICHIKVEETSAESISITPNGPFSLKIGEKVQLNASVLPETATDKSVSWQSSSENVTVSSDGLVTAIAPVENREITATNSAGQTDKVYVTVTPTLVSEISVDKSEITLKVGETTTVTATIIPDDATNKAIEWNSQNPQTASIAEDGVICANSLGDAVISVQALDGSGVSQCIIVHVVPTPTTDITIEQPATTSFKAGEIIRLTAQITPEDATDKTVSWVSSDPEIAVVEDGVVTAVGIGSVTITATASGGQRSEITLFVIPTLATSILLNQTSAELKIGDEIQLSAYVFPSGTTNTMVSWSSSNELVATVSDNGLVSTIGEGVTVISATTVDGSELSAECEVKVSPIPTITWNQEFECAPGDIIELTALSNTDQLPAYRSLCPYGGFINAEIFTENEKTFVKFTEEGPHIIEASIKGCTVEKRFNVISNQDELLYIDGIYYQYANSEKTELKVVRGYKMYAGDYSIPSFVMNLPVTKIENNAFYACFSLGDIEVGDGISHFGSESFGNGTLHSISIPSSVTTIENYCFNALRHPSGDSYYGNLEEIKLYSFKPIVISEYIFNGFIDYSNCVLHVPAGTIDRYRNAEVWKNFTNIIDDLPGEVVAEKIMLSLENTTLKCGESAIISATVLPENTSDKTIRWSVSDESVITIDQNGLITALYPGEAYVYAESANGLMESLLIVVEPIYVEHIEIPESLVIGTTEQYQFTPVIYPENASIKDITWTTSDSSVAEVNADDNSLRINGTGTAVISCHATDGSGVSASINVNVIRRIASISLDRYSVTLMEKQTTQLTAYIDPVDATDYELQWQSSNEEVATVDSNGYIEALAAGQTMITTTALQDGNIYNDECLIIVEKEVTGITSISLDEIKILVENGSLIVRNLPVGITATVYNLSGTLIAQKQSIGEDIIFNLCNNPVYILSIGNHNLKVYMK